MGIRLVLSGDDESSKLSRIQLLLPVGEDVVYEIDDVQFVVEGDARDGDRNHGA